MATFVKQLKQHIFLHPRDKFHLNKAVKATLLQDKKKYSHKLQGALLDVTDIKVVGTEHLVVSGCSSMEVVADCTVFCPEPGMMLEGRVNKLSRSHLGCLVLDTFNASLVLPSHRALTPALGQLCRFKVTEVIVDQEILFVRGVAQGCHDDSNTEMGQDTESQYNSNGDETNVGENNTEYRLELQDDLLSKVKEEPPTLISPKKHKSKKKQESVSDEKNGKTNLDPGNVHLSKEKEETLVTPMKHKSKKKRKSESQHDYTEVKIKEVPISSQESVSSCGDAKKKRKRKIKEEPMSPQEEVSYSNDAPKKKRKRKSGLNDSLFSPIS